eukprot:544103_1
MDRLHGNVYTIDGFCVEYLLFGYIREIEKIIRITDSQFFVIPDSIIYLCLLHYYSNETFKHCNTKVIKITENRATMMNTAYGGKSANMRWSTCYGSIKIPSFRKVIYCWRFRIVKKTSNMGIGISETIYTRKNKCFMGGKLNSNGARYGYWHHGFKWDSETHYLVKYYTAYGTGDIVEMILNMNNRTLSYAINDDVVNVAFYDIKTGENIEYCMAISTLYKGDSVSILNYSETIVC